MSSDLGKTVQQRLDSGSGFRTGVVLIGTALIMAVIFLVVVTLHRGSTIGELTAGYSALQEQNRICGRNPKDPICDREIAPPVQELVDESEVQESELQNIEIQEREEQDPEQQEPELQEAEEQDRELQQREAQDPDPNDLETQEEERQEAEEQEAEAQDEEIQDAEEQEAEVQDPEEQDPEQQEPEQQDPEVNDPQDPAATLTFNDFPAEGQTTTCRRVEGSPPNNPAYDCTSSAPPAQ